MKTVVLSVLMVCASLNAQYLISDFNSANPLHVTPSAFGGDVYTSPHGWQEIGGLGKATSPGVAYSDSFSTPIDFTGGYGSFGDFRTWTTITSTVPNPSYDPARPIGLFNPGPPDFTYTTVVQTGGAYVPTPTFALTWAQGQNTSAKWRLTFYDGLGGSAYGDVDGGSPGAFHYALMSPTDMTGSLNWSHVNQLSIAAISGGTVQGAFDTLATVVPEPQHYAIAAGIALVAFAGWRRFAVAAKA